MFSACARPSCKRRFCVRVTSLVEACRRASNSGSFKPRFGPRLALFHNARCDGGCAMHPPARSSSSRGSSAWKSARLHFHQEKKRSKGKKEPERHLCGLEQGGVSPPRSTPNTYATPVVSGRLASILVGPPSPATAQASAEWATAADTPRDLFLAARALPFLSLPFTRHPCRL